MEGTEHIIQERESKLYDDFDRFTFEKGEWIHSYYLRYAKLLNDMNIINMKMTPIQINMKLGIIFSQNEELKHKKLELSAGSGNKNFLADCLKNDCIQTDDLQLHTTYIFKEDHVDAFDSDCDEAPTASAIFMARLSPAGSINGGAFGSTYDLNILFEISHYNTYHETDMLNHVVQEMKYSKHLVYNNDSNDELMSDSNVTSYVEYMTTIKNDAAQSVPPLEQDNAMILSVIKQMQS
ncbi:hypothetical protein Tco_0364939 [Tanacetum coccineum]